MKVKIREMNWNFSYDSPEWWHNIQRGMIDVSGIEVEPVSLTDSVDVYSE